MGEANYSPTDALTYLREVLGAELDSIYDDLAEAYGVDTIDGEEYLPGALSEAMGRLYALHWDLTDACVHVGAHRRENGCLYRPFAYSNGLPVYVDHPAIQVINHPADDLPASLDGMARRAGQGVKDGGDCA